MRLQSGISHSPNREPADFSFCFHKVMTRKKSTTRPPLSKRSWIPKVKGIKTQNPWPDSTRAQGKRYTYEFGKSFLLLPGFFFCCYIKHITHHNVPSTSNTIPCKVLFPPSPSPSPPSSTPLFNGPNLFLARPPLLSSTSAAEGNGIIFTAAWCCFWSLSCDGDI